MLLCRAQNCASFDTNISSVAQNLLEFGSLEVVKLKIFRRAIFRRYNGKKFPLFRRERFLFSLFRKTQLSLTSCVSPGATTRGGSVPGIFFLLCGRGIISHQLTSCRPICTVQVSANGTPPTPLAHVAQL